MILAFMAGAETTLDNTGNPKRIASGGGAGQILYQARSWALAESTLADEAVAPPPLSKEVSPTATGWGLEYNLMVEGPRDSSSPAHATNGTDVGLGLRDPDDDGFLSSSSDPTLKPVMTMLYFPANDMLHAFRAGRSAASATKPCTVSSTVDCGGEEVWGFVPYDQLLNLRMRMRPQTRANHTYMMASSVRFAEVFVPNTGTTGNYSVTNTTTHTVGGVTTPSMLGVWRRILWFGRGPGGSTSPSWT